MVPSHDVMCLFVCNLKLKEVLASKLKQHLENVQIRSIKNESCLLQTTVIRDETITTITDTNLAAISVTSN